MRMTGVLEWAIHNYVRDREGRWRALDDGRNARGFALLKKFARGKQVAQRVLRQSIHSSLADQRYSRGEANNPKQWHWLPEGKPPPDQPQILAHAVKLSAGAEMGFLFRKGPFSIKRSVQEVTGL